MMWDTAGYETRLERHFGDRVVRCFLDRPAHGRAIFEQACRHNPHGEAAVSDDRRLTYADMGKAVDRIASGFAEDGIGRGDRVALMVGQCVEMPLGVFALWKLGAIAVPVDNRLLISEVQHILLDCGAGAIVFDPHLRDRIPKSAGALTHLTRYVTSGDPAKGERAFATLGEGPGNAPAVDLAEEDDALIVYTSGTSGKPKGAVVAHLNVVHTVKHYEMAWGLTAADRSLLAIPATNITGLVAIIITVANAGGCVVYMRSFKARDFLTLAHRERTTHAFMVPAMYKLCLMAPEFDSHDLSSWRLGSYGGSVMPPDMIAELARRLPDLSLMNGYGATETTSPAVMLPQALTALHSDTVGFALPCSEIAVMNESGREVPRGEQGELWIRGPMVVSRYWNNADETKASFVAGYWRSGDLCSLDDQGFVRFHDRLRDTINRGGYKIPSAEVETALAAHDGVQEVAVIARPDNVLGERVHAVVMVRNGILQEADLREFLKARLADYKVPESFTLTQEPLPRNANGKVLKRKLRADLFTNTS